MATIIHIPSHSKQQLGGGFSFRRTFTKYAPRSGMTVTEDQGKANVILISGATMVDRDSFNAWKAAGKRIVFRVDNVPRNSRNRNTGTSRLRDYAQGADLVIYQSNWARDFLAPFTGKDGPVILNGADTDIFKPDPLKTQTAQKDGEPQYLYLQFNRDETKQWHQAWHQYILEQRRNPKSHLWIAGQFSPEQVEYGFDFFMGERFHYWGVVEDAHDLAAMYRATDVLMLPYFNDACSNTLIEALLCGVTKVWHNGTGGTQQIMETPIEKLTAQRMTDEYAQHIDAIL